MKKIVALVLAMVMVLGLATVASAASYSSQETKGTTTTVTAAEKLAVYDADTTTKMVDSANKAWTVLSYTSLSTKVVTTDGASVTSYIPAYYAVDMNNDGNVDAYLMEAADAFSAEYRLFKDGVFVTYLSKGLSSVDYIADAATFVAKGENCGDYPTYVYVVDGVAKSAIAGTTPAVMGNKVVYYGDTVAPIAHDFALATAYPTNGIASADTALVYKSTTDSTVVGVTCDECDKTFTVVEYGLIPATYKGVTFDLQVGSDWYTILLQDVPAAVAPEADAAEKVESAETFDAGIAMYVGMSVMAAAGSAVVLKKKD